MYRAEIITLVRLVFLGLIFLPIIALFILLFRKPGYRHDNTRRWVDYTKAAMGLWILGTGLQVITHIVSLAVSYDHWDSPLVYAMNALGIISMFVESLSHISLFLALFYLAHALTQLRTEGAEPSTAYLKGRRVSLGVSIFASLLSLTAMCLFFSSHLGPWLSSDFEDFQRRNLRSLIASIFDLIVQSIIGACSIGSLVYAVKARKKARDTPLAKAGKLLVIAAALYLVFCMWYIVATVFGRTYYYYGTFLTGFDIVFGILLFAIVVTLLYLLATKEKYSLSKIHFRAKNTNHGPTV